MPKIHTQSPKIRHSRRHNPLSEEYAPTGPLKQKAGKKRNLKLNEEADSFVDSRASRKILAIGQELIAEEEAGRKSSEPNPAFGFESRFGEDDDLEEDTGGFEDDDDAWGDEEEDLEEVGVDPNDLHTFNRFNPSFWQQLPDLSSLLNPNGASKHDEDEGNQGTNLADLILEKIAAHEAATASIGKQQQTHRTASPSPPPELPSKALEVYTQIGQLLSRHRSGPLPKPFKILPSLPLSQIPPLIALTNPQSWTPHAHLLATRLFISSAPGIAQPFLTNVLLPRIRDDIHETKKLHVHLYAALKKALYKPAAFFKGLLFPLLESGTATLREAHIIGSVIARVSVPVLHSAAALLRLCDIGAAQFTVSKESGGGGAVNSFIRVLLEKKYALPYKVIDALVFHFLRFRALETQGSGEAESDRDIEMDSEARTGRGMNAQGRDGALPVIWHQCFLAFAQRYRNDITEDQREALLDLVIAKGHKGIGPEVRRELLEGRGRGVPVAEESAGVGGDDTMVMEVA